MASQAPGDSLANAAADEQSGGASQGDGVRHRARGTLSYPIFHTSHWPMVLVVLGVILLGLVITALALWAMGLFLFGALPGTLTPAPPNANGGDEGWLGLLKVALTVAAGVGGAVALTVAYRKQRLAERHEPRQVAEEERAAAAAQREAERSHLEQYRAAVEQLANGNSTVRLAGVYALANLADAWTARRQQCVDVLCAHVRTPWNSDQSSPGIGAIQEQETTADGKIITRSYPDQSGESEVRSTILRVIGAHLRTGKRPTGYESWSEMELDLSGGDLNNLDWSDCEIGPVNFREATFREDAWFSRSTFTGSAGFTNANFGGDVVFSDAVFHADAVFTDAIFVKEAWFKGATFHGDGVFHEAAFGSGVWFHEATFGGNARFYNATFAKSAIFDHVDFNREARFDNVSFEGEARFHGATFADFTLFSGARFSSVAWFAGAAFGEDGPDLDDAIFEEGSQLIRASSNALAPSPYEGVAGLPD
ncbi:MAG: pentapeptide repeat-containing protein [Propionibacteriaceae bacterium]|nr:pentapeptide repeat-containing protein [Propionibacteriaceae bacterium]